MQKLSNLTARISGLAAMLGGLLWSAKAFYDKNDAPPWPTDVTDTLFFLVLGLFLAALVGLYARCKGEFGEWKAISFVGVVVGLGGLTSSIVGQLTIVFEVGPAWWFGTSWWMFVFGFFVMNLSLVFVGNSIVQSGALPRWEAVPFLIGSLGILLILVGDPPNSELGVYPSLTLWMLYGLGWAALGWVLMTKDKSLAGSLTVSRRLETSRTNL